MFFPKEKHLLIIYFDCIHFILIFIHSFIFYCLKKKEKKKTSFTKILNTC